MELNKKRLSLFDVLAIAKAMGIDSNVKRVNLSEINNLEDCANQKDFVLTSVLEKTILSFFEDGKDYAYIVVGSEYYITESYDFATRFAIKNTLIDMHEKEIHFTF